MGPDSGGSGGVPADVAARLVRAFDMSPSTVVALISDDLRNVWVSRSVAWVVGDEPMVTVEFQGAAYRFGHSMVRPSYRANLAGNADGSTRLLRWAATGVPSPKYASEDARNAEIEAVAAAIRNGLLVGAVEAEVGELE